MFVGGRETVAKTTIYVSVVWCEWSHSYALQYPWVKAAAAMVRNPSNRHKLDHYQMVLKASHLHYRIV